MHSSIENVTPSSQDKMLHFLKQRENFSLFLLGNFENYGATLSNAPYSGNFKLITSSDQVIGVFCLTKLGNLLIETDAYESLFEPILTSCQEERIPITGLSGSWNFCYLFWKFLKEKKVVLEESFSSKATLYTIDISPHPRSFNSLTRLLSTEDYTKWKPLRLDYLKEERLPNHHTDDQLLELFIDKVEKKIIWGLFIEDQLISIAELNAKSLDLGQAGGVYTVPRFRQQGYARSMMQKLLCDVKHLHKIRKLIIFTDEKNTPAKRLYESLRGIHVGYFALLFSKD